MPQGPERAERVEGLGIDGVEWPILLILIRHCKDRIPVEEKIPRLQDSKMPKIFGVLESWLLGVFLWHDLLTL